MAWRQRASVGSRFGSCTLSCQLYTLFQLVGRMNSQSSLIWNLKLTGHSFWHPFGELQLQYCASKSWIAARYSKWTNLARIISQVNLIAHRRPFVPATTPPWSYHSRWWKSGRDCRGQRLLRLSLVPQQHRAWPHCYPLWSILKGSDKFFNRCDLCRQLQQWH